MQMYCYLPIKGVTLDQKPGIDRTPGERIIKRCYHVTNWWATFIPSGAHYKPPTHTNTLPPDTHPCDCKGKTCRAKPYHTPSQTALLGGHL